ncbi:uncharacterized protein [Pyxicephalus adspersus]|uniref:uncharacterized protein n=1 Tax=Pyxicephalus adspersus TaxID=30357 RepID=UPI003B5A213A
MTFGFNCQNKQHYGIMMYHRNRLIKSYVRVGCQLKDNYMGIGVVGIIECNFLRPTHNKQDFIYTREYRLTLSALGSKLDDYWVEKKEKLKTVTVGFLEKEKKPDQTWVQCDQCLKWRKLPDGIGKLPEKWYCHMNPDPQFRDCNVPEEPEDDEEITQPTYEKTHKKKVSNTPTIQSIPLDEKMKAASSPAPLPGPSSATPGTAGRVRLQANRQKRSGAPECTLGPAKKPYVAISETNELLNVDGNAADDVIIIEDSTPKLNDNSKTPNSITPGLNTGVGASATVTNRGVMNVKHECSNDYANNSHQVLNNNNYSLSIGTTTQDPNDYCKRCEELSVKVKHLEDQLAVALGQQVEKETSQAYIQTDPVPTQDKSRELLLSQYEQAVEEVHQLKILCNTLQARKAEPEASQVELLKQQKLQTDAEIVKLKTEVEQLIKETQNAASASTSFAERTKL